MTDTTNVDKTETDTSSVDEVTAGLPNSGTPNEALTTEAHTELFGDLTPFDDVSAESIEGDHGDLNDNSDDNSDDNSLSEIERAHAEGDYSDVNYSEEIDIITADGEEITITMELPPGYSPPPVFLEDSRRGAFIEGSKENFFEPAVITPDLHAWDQANATPQFSNEVIANDNADENTDSFNTPFIIDGVSSQGDLNTGDVRPVEGVSDDVRDPFGGTAEPTLSGSGETTGVLEVANVNSENSTNANADTNVTLNTNLDSDLGEPSEVTLIAPEVVSSDPTEFVQPTDSSPVDVIPAIDSTSEVNAPVDVVPTKDPANQPVINGGQIIADETHSDTPSTDVAKVDNSGDEVVNQGTVNNSMSSPTILTKNDTEEPLASDALNSDGTEPDHIDTSDTDDTLVDNADEEINKDSDTETVN